jgi:nitrite reductase/ring-hydroxylating ferredoxin subunit
VSEHRPDLKPLSAGVVSGVGVVVVRPDDAARPQVLANRCSHRGGPLSEGELAGHCIRCPWQHSEFDLATGSVRCGPAVAPQAVYEVRSSREHLEVRRDEPRSLRLNGARP